MHGHDEHYRLNGAPFHGVTFLVGPNGSGKTRLLRRLALERARRNHPTRIICNTPFDRYAGIRGSVKRLSARNGASQPAEVLKKAIVAAYAESSATIGRLRSILAYSGYEAQVEVRPIGVDPNRLRFVEEAAVHYGLHMEARSIGDAARYLLEHARVDNWVYLDGDHGKHVFSGPTLDMIRWEHVFRRARFLKRVDLHLVRSQNGMVLAMKDGSSGELSLIAALTFLVSHVDHECSILIDEPENSLHPAWQRSYVERILAVTSLWRPEIIIATHSPLIVSGTQALQDVASRVFRVDDAYAHPLEHETEGLEQTLWHLFDTITPSNHFLSVELVKLVNVVKQDSRYRDIAFHEIWRLERASYSEDQAPLFHAARSLVEQIARGRG